MNLIRCKDYQELSRWAAEVMAAEVKRNPDAVLGLATGSTPVGMYGELVKMHREESLDFSRVTTYNLDEYYPIQRTNDQSYYTFMRKNLFDHINVPVDHIHLPNGEAADPDAEAARYEQMILDAGGIDCMLLGVGMNGHIGFNEPADALESATHVTGLTESTIEANSRFFDSADLVPRRALTMGMRSILSAKHCLLLIAGESKRPMLDELLSGKVTTNCPVTLLNTVRNLSVITDIQ